MRRCAPLARISLIRLTGASLLLLFWVDEEEEEEVVDDRPLAAGGLLVSSVTRVQCLGLCQTNQRSSSSGDGASNIRKVSRGTSFGSSSSSWRVVDWT